jgi:hypothetical protein
MEETQMCQIKLHLTLVIVGMLFIIVPKELLADCGWEGPFLENAEQADLIVWGKVLAYHEKAASSPPYFLKISLEVEILDVYKGTFDNSKLRIANDAFSGIGLHSFPVGTKWILALKQWPNGNYTIPGCFGSWLKVEPSIVGNLDNTTEHNAKQRISLDEFRNLFKEKKEPSLLPSNYEEGLQAGLRQCRAWYWSGEYGRLHIPAVDVIEASGNIITYRVELEQIEPSFVFELDLDSVTAHQQ